MADTCILIDYTAGECWELPYELYEKYSMGVAGLVLDGLSAVQTWMATLTHEEREMVSKK